MNSTNPIYLSFGGMEKLGPGGNTHAPHILRLLPKLRLGVIVYAGCGTGRQALAVAKALGTPIHAVDSYEPFSSDLAQRAGQIGGVTGDHHFETGGPTRSFTGG